MILKPGLRDWTRVKFTGGDIKNFIATIAMYESTKSIGLRITTT